MIHYKYSLLFGLALLMSGCGDSDDSPVAPPVTPDKPDKPISEKVVTFTTDVLTRSVVTELGDKDEMNVFAKEYQTLGAEDFMKTALKSVNKGGTWKIVPEVKLDKDQKVFLYAVYPYDAIHSDPTSIPVDATRQIDYLYSGEGVLASYSSPSAKLTMNHALSVLSFNVCKSAYNGAGNLQNIVVKGEKFPVSASLNIEKGTLSEHKKGVLSIKCNKEITSEGWTEGLPQTFTIPTESDGSNVSLTLTIDGKEHMLVLPVLKIEQGYKYIFRLGLTDSGVTIFADATEKISLKQESDKMPVEGGVSSVEFTFNGKTVALPQITGKSLIPGIVKWGDNSSTGLYNYGMNHTYLDGGKHVVSVETWNAEEITFSSIKGVDAIDLSNF